MFRASSCSSSGATTAVAASGLPSEFGDSSAVGRVRADRPDHDQQYVWFQKLTRNLFLTLHGHNVHSQQRQLSKFLMRYQQFASHAYCGAAGPVSKMASQQQKAFCVLRFEVSRSVMTVQRELCHSCMMRLF